MGRDSIELQEYERAQLVEALDTAISNYQAQSLDDRADDLQRLRSSLTMAHTARTPEQYDFGADNWDLIARALDTIDDTRVAWLATKISRRAELDPGQMGFTTRMPVGVMQTGSVPSRDG